MRWLALLLISAVAFSLPMEWLEMARGYDFSFALKNGKVFLLTWMGNYTVWIKNGKISDLKEGLEGDCEYRLKMEREMEVPNDPDIAFQMLKKKFMEGEIRLEGCNAKSSIKAFLFNIGMKIAGLLQKLGLKII